MFQHAIKGPHRSKDVALLSDILWPVGGAIGRTCWTCLNLLPTFRVESHLQDSFGRPRTVLCHTTGKLVTLQKFWVTATVQSRLITTCHQPAGTNTVSPACWTSSSYSHHTEAHTIPHSISHRPDQ